ncbi:MAG: helix-turn-helix domain-containing protein [Betaproteobacteria bacterium]|nr:helix-turn-helix domain-containing protein [Betaproteobacteria bacterium]
MRKTIYTEEYRALLAWLRRGRKRRGLTMAQAAAMVGKPASWVAKTECGERRLDVAEYAQYCYALGILPARGLAVFRGAHL